jgi:uncharacterized membrane protein YkvA (DUF1232 family)
MPGTGLAQGVSSRHDGCMSMKDWAAKLKQHTLTVYFVARDPRTPLFVRLLALLIAAYALSPIDLIPDFIPLIGYLDDLLLIPLGIALVVRFSPLSVVEAAREKAAHVAKKPVSYVTAVVFVAVWLILVLMFARWVVGVAVK